LALPPLQQAAGAINQYYPQAQGAITQYGGQALGTLQNLYQMFAPGAQTYASAVGGATGPGSAWNAFTQSPFYQGPLSQGTDAINAAEAKSGKLASGQQALDLSKYMSNYNAGQYTNWLNTLAPAVTGASNAATNIAGTQGNIGTALAGSYQGQANALQVPLTAESQLGWGYGTGIGAANAQQGVLDATLGGNLLSGLLGLGGKIFSDERLKRDVEKIGETYDGLGIFKYSYLWDADDTTRIGLVAQDVQRHVPGAVSEAFGYKVVDQDLATRGSALARVMRGGA
jgi:hypothetical protein